MRREMSDNEILESLLRKDDTALAVLYELHANYLLGYFQTKFSAIDSQILQSCVCDSLIEFAKHPERYKPEKSALKSYLIMDTQRNLLNEIDKEKRRKSKTVELSSKVGNNKNEEKNEVEDIDTNSLKQQIKEYFSFVFGNPLDERLAWMIKIEKVRETSAYAQLLQIQHLSFPEQEDEVKRHKDRIGAQLRRKGWTNFTKKLKQDASR